MTDEQDKPMEQMYLEDVVEAVERILAAPLPIVGDRRVLLEKRVALALEVLRGTVHPGDVTVAPLPSIDEQVGNAFAGLRAALSP